MPPKFDPNEVKFVYLRAVGGEVGATSSLAPKVSRNIIPRRYSRNGERLLFFTAMLESTVVLCTGVSSVTNSLLPTKYKIEKKTVIESYGVAYIYNKSSRS